LRETTKVKHKLPSKRYINGLKLSGLIECGYGKFGQTIGSYGSKYISYPHTSIRRTIKENNEIKIGKTKD